MYQEKGSGEIVGLILSEIPYCAYLAAVIKTISLFLIGQADHVWFTNAQIGYLCGQ